MTHRKTRTPAIHRDDGVSMVLVAIVMVVLIAMVGFALDVGAIYGERTQLSRGADAAVLAIAEECVLNPSSCDEETMEALAQQYANLNVNDGAAGIAGFDLDLEQRRVEVITESLDPEDGSTELKMNFLRVLGFTGTTVHARAVAIWGWLRAGMVAPFTFPECAYDWFLEQQDDAPPEGLIYRFRNIGETDCEGLQPPGGFGFLDVDDSCTTYAEEDEHAQGDPGTNWDHQNCDATHLQNATILIPMHCTEMTHPEDDDCIIGQGQNQYYKVTRFFGFHVTGYKFPAGGTWPSGFNCGGGGACIRGYFTEITEWDGEIGGTPGGVTVIRLVE